MLFISSRPQCVKGEGWSMIFFMEPYCGFQVIGTTQTMCDSMKIYFLLTDKFPACSGVIRESVFSNESTVGIRRLIWGLNCQSSIVVFNAAPEFYLQWRRFVITTVGSFVLLPVCLFHWLLAKLRKKYGRIIKKISICLIWYKDNIGVCSTPMGDYFYFWAILAWLFHAWLYCFTFLKIDMAEACILGVILLSKMFRVFCII